MRELLEIAPSPDDQAVGFDIEDLYLWIGVFDGEDDAAGNQNCLFAVGIDVRRFIPGLRIARYDADLPLRPL